jgi:GxxExxY protein
MALEDHRSNEGKFEGESLTKAIIEAIIQVHQTLGPGFLESIYRNALILELAARGLSGKSEQQITVYYEGKVVGRHILDVVVNEVVVLELKAVEELCSAHYAQLRSYLKASKIKTGLLVNFGSEKADFRRVELK